nr:hypothetical protein [Candidatus Woesearchaeota archaeon]
MLKNVYFIIGACLLFAGLFLNDVEITGNFIGISNYSTLINPFISLFFIFTSIYMFTTGINLEERTYRHWRKYRLNRSSKIMDIEQEYLSRKRQNEKTGIQKSIETIVSGGLIKEDVNKKTSYEEQFYEGHAAKGGRVIDVESHIARRGENKGKLIHFGQPANAKYMWVVDEDNNFIIANKQIMLHEMPQMNKAKIDYHHRLHKLPHATLARGKRIYGAGEVTIEGGKIRSFNAYSGHYVNLKDIKGFNRQSEEVFHYYIKKLGWKEIEGGAEYKSNK